MRSSNQWSSTRSVGRYELTDDIGEWLLNFVDRLKLDINTVGYWLNGLSVKWSDATLVGAGFESRECGIVDAHC